jgi:DNA-binding NarL/FixJ family response regulator
MNLVHVKDRVVLIEDDSEIREAFRTIIDSSQKFQVVGDFGSYEESVSFIRRKNPGIILMDIGLPGIDGIEATRKIKHANPFIEIIIISVYEDNEYVFNALKSGASGYISKSSNHFELVKALEEVRLGGAPMSSKIARMLVDDLHLNTIDSPLTVQETRILQQLSSGKTYTQIAEDLIISKDTVKTHIRNIYRKLHVDKKSKAIEAGRLQKII